MFHDVTRPPLPAVMDANKRFFYFNLHFCGRGTENLPTAAPVQSKPTPRTHSMGNEPIVLVGSSRGAVAADRDAGHRALLCPALNQAHGPQASRRRRRQSWIACCRRRPRRRAVPSSASSSVPAPGTCGGRCRPAEEARRSASTRNTQRVSSFTATVHAEGPAGARGRSGCRERVHRRGHRRRCAPIELDDERRESRTCCRSLRARPVDTH